ncbi:MAG: hypothetical protein HQ492_05005, partial [Woeseiaceae bacterium]|nr:hypothetical protein [Woeseiaceae bacterium]
FITDSTIPFGDIVVTGGGLVKGNSMLCLATPCLYVSGDYSEIVANSISSDVDTFNPAVEIIGDKILFSDNIIAAYFCSLGARFTGNNNLIAGNLIRGVSWVGLKIDGSGNIVKDNALVPDVNAGYPGTYPVAVGINFLQDGNFYGDNQMSAIVPFELNGTVQTDLGGNVGY